MRQSIEFTVKNRIIEHGRGWCFTPIHFSDLGSDISKGNFKACSSSTCFKGTPKRLWLMEPMFFREIPEWELLLKKIEGFENEFNHTN